MSDFVLASKILTCAISNNLDPNGESGLGRALWFSCQDGNVQLIKKIIAHPKFNEIIKDGPFGLMHARSAAMSKLHFEAAALIADKQDL